MQLQSSHSLKYCVTDGLLNISIGPIAKLTINRFPWQDPPQTYGQFPNFSVTSDKFSVTKSLLTRRRRANRTHLRTRRNASSKGRKYGVAIRDTALYAFVLYRRAMKPRFTLSQAACSAVQHTHTNNCNNYNNNYAYHVSAGTTYSLVYLQTPSQTLLLLFLLAHQVQSTVFTVKHAIYSKLLNTYLLTYLLILIFLYVALVERGIILPVRTVTGGLSSRAERSLSSHAIHSSDEWSQSSSSSSSSSLALSSSNAAESLVSMATSVGSAAAWLGNLIGDDETIADWMLRWCEQLISSKQQQQQQHNITQMQKIITHYRHIIT